MSTYNMVTAHRATGLEMRVAVVNTECKGRGVEGSGEAGVENQERKGKRWE